VRSLAVGTARDDGIFRTHLLDLAFLLPPDATSLSIACSMLAFYLHKLDPFIFRLWDDVGPRWYGMAYVLAFVCGYALLSRFSKKGYLDLPQSAVGDFITWTALFGVMVGGRLGYVLFYRPEMLREPLSILRVWEGGMSSHGGMLGVVLFSLYYARRHKISWTNLGDNLVVAVPIGMFLGRCANFINGELYGRIANLPWAMQFPKALLEPGNSMEAESALAASREIDPSLRSIEVIVEAVRTNPQIETALRGILSPRHPSQLYEAFLEGAVLFAILWLVRTRARTPNGFLTGLFMICYGIFRIVVEYFREPDAALIGMFTRGQFFSFFVVVLGIGFIVAAKRRPTYPRKLSA
jgi:phosphatidylglycerol:prolipoprotein diacylglycerol transferase